jgi:hypothetical protein
MTVISKLQLMGQGWAVGTFSEYSFLEYSVYTLAYVFAMAAFVLQQRQREVGQTT